MRNITGLSIPPASDYAESGCKGTTFLRNYQIFLPFSYESWGFSCFLGNELEDSQRHTLLAENYNEL